MTTHRASSIYRRLLRSLCRGLLIALLIVAAVNIAAVLFAKVLAPRGYWLENKVWKGVLLEAQVPAPEVAMVGSSRTQNHFNSEYFNSRGHRFFNFGTPGLLPWDFPSMVQQAATVATKTVLISLPAEILFLPVGCPKLWGGADLLFYARYAPSCLRQLSLAQWLQPLPINAFFSETYPDVRYHPCRGGEHSMAILLGSAYTPGLCDDRRQLAALRYSRRWVAVYANGDGMILPDGYPPRAGQIKWTDRRGQSFPAQTLNFLRHLATIVTDEGKTPIFVIEASPVEHLLIDQDLQQLTGVRTLYMNEIAFADDEIADRDHLGLKGNQRVTKWLFDALVCPAEAQGCAQAAGASAPEWSKSQAPAQAPERAQPPP